MFKKWPGSMELKLSKSDDVDPDILPDGPMFNKGYEAEDVYHYLIRFASEREHVRFEVLWWESFDGSMENLADYFRQLLLNLDYYAVHKD